MTCIDIFSFLLCCALQFPRNKRCSVCLFISPICFVEGSCFIYLYLFTYTGVQHDFHIRWCSCRLSLTVGRRVSLVEQELLTLPEQQSSPPVFSGVRVARAIVFCVVFCRSLFVLLSSFLWSLSCLSFDLRLLATPLEFSKLFFLYLSQVKTLIFTGICRGRFCIHWFELRCGYSVCWYFFNCWPFPF